MQLLCLFEAALGVRGFPKIVSANTFLIFKSPIIVGKRLFILQCLSDKVSQKSWFNH